MVSTRIALTKLDVLDGLPEVLHLHRLQDGDGNAHGVSRRICALLVGAEPVYETLPGWSTPTQAA